MTTTLLRVALAAALASSLALAACGDGKPKPSEVAYGDIKAKAADADALKASFSKDYTGKHVVWSGKVVESKQEHGDDFAIITKLYVDMDGGPADVSFKVLPSEAEALKAGDEVKFKGTITEYKLTDGQIVIELAGAKLIQEKS